MIKVLRWIAVLPAGVLGAVIIVLLAKLFGLLFDPIENYGLLSLVFDGVYSVLLGAMFVLVGSFVAPEYHKTTSIVLATLGVTFCIVCLCLQLFVKKEMDLQIIISCVATAIGCVCGSVYVHDLENRE